MASKLKIQLEADDFSKAPKSCWKRLFGDRDWVDITSVFLLPIIGAVVGAAWVWFQHTSETNKQYNDTLSSYFSTLQSLENDILTYELGSEIEAKKRTEAESLIQSLALAKTLLVLQNLDPPRKGQVIQYLHNSGLMPVRYVDYDSTDNFRCPNLSKGAESILFKKIPISDEKIGNIALEDVDLTKNNFLPGIKLDKIGLNEINFTEANLDCSSFTRSTITYTDFNNAFLRGADFSGAYLGQVDFFGASLAGANFSEATIFTPDRLKALSRGNYKPLLRGNYLRFNKAILTDANLSNANFSNASFSNANLSNANLSNADLGNADLGNANFSNANLSNANLNNASFSNTDLSNSVLLATDFRNAKNLQAAQLTGDKPPLLCNVALPDNITDVDRNRDCDKIPEALVNQFPKNQSYRSLGNRDVLLSLEEATQLVNEAKQKKWN